MCQNTIMRVHGAWIKIYCTLHSCHNFPAGSRQAARGLRICETSVLGYIIKFEFLLYSYCKATYFLEKFSMQYTLSVINTAEFATDVCPWTQSLLYKRLLKLWRYMYRSGLSRTWVSCIAEVIAFGTSLSNSVFRGFISQNSPQALCSPIYFWLWHCMLRIWYMGTFVYFAHSLWEWLEMCWWVCPLSFVWLVDWWIGLYHQEANYIHACAGGTGIVNMYLAPVCLPFRTTDEHFCKKLFSD